MRNSQKLAQLIDLYFEAKQKVIAIESESAVSALHQSYVNDIRHTLDHLMTALKLEQDPAKADEAENHYVDAVGHINNLGPDAYQYIAGVKLKKLKEKIEEAGFFGETGKAQSILSVAFEHYNMGRQLRTSQPQQSMEHFRNCTTTCNEGSLQVEFPTRKDVVNFWKGVLGGGGVIGIVWLLSKLFC